MHVGLLAGLLTGAAFFVASNPAFAQGTVSNPVSDGGITPYIIEGVNEGGNRTCSEVGTAFFGDPNYYELESDRINYDQDGNVFDGPFPMGLTVSVSDNDTFVTWSSSFGIGAIIVKGSSDANVYVYNPQSNGDSGLASPPNPSGGSAALSNITFCWNPEEQQAEWCSPGYWRQTQHLDSWTATGIDPCVSGTSCPANSYYNYHFDPDLAGNPTLWQVLQSPQTYGGPAFNNVGDLLSMLHPDVNFTGGRVEDSCPLD